MLSSSGSNPALASDPLAGYLWRSRVVVIFAPGPEDKHLTQQKHIISRMGSGAAERDLAIVEILGPTAEADTMRCRLETPGSGFQVVLVGKDGGVKLRSAQPLAADTLMNTIDAMPMRRQEMQRR